MIIKYKGKQAEKEGSSVSIFIKIKLTYNSVQLDVLFPAEFDKMFLDYTEVTLRENRKNKTLFRSLKT